MELFNLTIHDDPEEPDCLKSDGSNYILWSYKMRTSRIGELWECVIGSEARPDPNEENCANLWESWNEEVLKIINTCVDRNLKKRLARFKSAKEAWDYLAGLYAHDDESNLAKRYRLGMEIRASLKHSSSIIDFYTPIQSYWDILAEMEPDELSDLDSYKKFREESRLVQFLTAIPNKFEQIRKSILSRSILPSISEAVKELINEEHRLACSQLSSLSLKGKDKNKTGTDECGYCHRTGHKKASCPAIMKKNVKTKQQSGGSRKADVQESTQPSDKHHQPSSSSSRPESMQPLDKHQQLSSSSSRPAPSLIPDTNQPAHSSDQFRIMVNLMAQVESDAFGPPERALYLPSSEKEDNIGLGTVKILSYNVWFQNLEIDKRMVALGNLIQLHSPDVICFQEVTPYIYDIFRQSSWWKTYHCSLSDEISTTRTYFCMQLSKLPVKSFNRKLFSNSRMLRELCMAEIEVKGGKPLIVATSHLESPCDQTYTGERVAQAKEALNLLNRYTNVVFCGDMNWDDDLDGKFPLSDGWIDWVDAWAELKPRENGWTYDTKSNQMLSADQPMQKRLDRFICNLHDFKLSAVDMIGMEAIPGLSYCKEKKTRKKLKQFILPILPSGHYGLLLKINCQ